jgi:hypothetical protein
LAEIKAEAKNRVRWKILVKALCSTAEWWDAILVYIIYIYIYLHRLAAKCELRWKKLPGVGGIKLLLLPLRFCKHVSYGFPITNFRNPGEHQETPCMCDSKVASSNVPCM